MGGAKWEEVPVSLGLVGASDISGLPRKTRVGRAMIPIAKKESMCVTSKPRR